MLGYVAYIDADGYTYPYMAGNIGREPYGIVTKINCTDQHTCSSGENTVSLVLSGIVGVLYRGEMEAGEKPKLGDLVNQFGGKYDESRSMDQVIGICDGITTAPTDHKITVVATRFGFGWRC